MFDFDGLDDAEEGTAPTNGDAKSHAEAGEVKEDATSPPEQKAVEAAPGGAGAVSEQGSAPAEETRATVAGHGGKGAAKSATMFDFDDLEDTDPSPTVPGRAPEPGATNGRTDVPAAAQRSSPAQDVRSSVASAAKAKKVYWRVVKTIDPGGISVRNDKAHLSGGRLQLYSVVLEKERKGNELRYELVGGDGGGPRTGWVKIETRGTSWLECLGSDYKEAIVDCPTDQAQQQRALILFDWDDTLCPTSWIEEVPQLRNALEGGVARSGEAWAKLCDQAGAVKELMETAVSIASVAFVTLAERPWVHVSVRDFLPAALPVTQLEVFYAREGVLPRAPPGACPLTAMKRRAMQAAVEKMVAKLGKGTTWESFISIGDSEIEKRAAQDLGREWQSKGVFKYTKTVKMMEHPNVKDLTSQCRVLNERLRELIMFQGHKHVTSSELMRPSALR